MPEDPATRFRIEREADEARSAITLAADGDKDAAAHSMEIANVTGADAQYIYGNYPIASRSYRRNLEHGIVDRDSQLQYYFNKSRRKNQG